jgi:uncharacterized protein
MSAAALKERLRADLKVALQARATEEVRVLRTLIAALDNAEAVPGEGVQDNSRPRAFGDVRGEVIRRQLDGRAVEALLSDETEARLAAAADYQRHGRTDEAERLRDEAALIARYAAS